MKFREAIKSLIILLLTVSMFCLTFTLISNEVRREGTGAVDASFASLLSGLGINLPEDIFKKKSEQSFPELDAAALIYPEYIAASEQGERVITVTQRGLTTLYGVIAPVICDALTRECPAVKYHPQSLLASDGVLIAFSSPVSADLFVRLYSEPLLRSDGVYVSPTANDPQIEFDYVYIDDESIYFYGKNGLYATALGYSEKTAVSRVRTSAFAFVAQEDATLAFCYSDIIPDAIGMGPSDSAALPILTPVRSIYSQRNKVFNDFAVNRIITLFGFNYSSMNNDTDADGTLTYVSNTAGISIQTDSILHFYSTQTSGGIPISQFITAENELGYSQRDVCAAAQKFLLSFSEYMSQPRLKGVSFDSSQNEFIIRFEFAHMGKRIHTDTDAAVFVYKNGFFTDISLNLTAYRATASKYDMRPLSELLPLIDADKVGTVCVGYYEHDQACYPEYYYTTK